MPEVGALVDLFLCLGSAQVGSQGGLEGSVGTRLPDGDEQLASSAESEVRRGREDVVGYCGGEKQLLRPA